MTSKNKKMLVDEEYEYYFNTKTQTRMYWECAKKEVCNARVITHLVGDDIVVNVISITPHTHIGDPCSIKLRVINESIKNLLLLIAIACPVYLYKRLLGL